MKLLFCPLCEDVIKIGLPHEDYRTCLCGASCGKYMTHEHAIYGGHAIPIGINNNAFILAMSNHLVTFEGWFYPPKDKEMGISSRHIHFLKGATDGKRTTAEELSVLRRKETRGRQVTTRDESDKRGE